VTVPAELSDFAALLKGLIAADGLTISRDPATLALKLWVIGPWGSLGTLYTPIIFCDVSAYTWDNGLAIGGWHHYAGGPDAYRGSLEIDPVDGDVRVHRNLQAFGTISASGGFTLPWTDWTPTVTQSGAVTATVTMARYARVGNVVHVEAYLAITGAGTTANSITIGNLPVNVANPAAWRVVGAGSVVDVSVGPYSGSVVATGAATLAFVISGAGNGYLGAGPAFALANGDIISFSATYEAA
jgi:hypothetical protein